MYVHVAFFLCANLHEPKSHDVKQMYVLSFVPFGHTRFAATCDQEGRHGPQRGAL